MMIVRGIDKILTQGNYGREKQERNLGIDMKLYVKVAWDSWDEEGPESLPLVWREYKIPPGLEEDVVR